MAESLRESFEQWGRVKGHTHLTDRDVSMMEMAYAAGAAAMKEKAAQKIEAHRSYGDLVAEIRSLQVT